MQILDVRTLSFVTGTTALAMFICMLHVALRRRTYPGFGYWCAAFIANFVGLVAISARSWAPEALSILAVNGFLILAAIFLCRGLAIFSGARTYIWFDIAAVVSLLSLQSYFTFQQYNVHIRTGFLGLWLSVFYLRATLLAHRPVAKVLGHCNCLLAGSFLGICLLSVCGGVTALFWKTNLSNLMNAGAPYAVSIIAYIALNTIIMAGLISINSTRLENDLISAKQEIVDLKGFLPICANCKKIRDDQGYWQQVERYLAEHTGAEMTHSICPDCLQKLYPDLMDDAVT